MKEYTFKSYDFSIFEKEDGSMTIGLAYPIATNKELIEELLEKGVEVRKPKNDD